MKIRGGTTGMMMLAVAGLVLTACGSSDSKVSVDKLQQAADKAKQAPTGPCPLGFDVNAALKKAGVSGTATPGTGTDPDQPPVDAESATTTDNGSALKLSGGAMITCSYTLSGGGYLEATLTGVRKGTAVALMAPMLARDGELALSQLEPYVTQKFATGKAIVTPGSAEAAAVVKLDASGGDVALEVTTDPEGNKDGSTDGRGPVSGEQLRKLSDELAKQVRV